jgi:AraC-like DNA-binding protein
MKERDVIYTKDGSGRHDVLRALAANIARWTKGSEHFATAIPGLTFYRHDEPTQLRSGLYEPSICLVAQGAKRAHLADDSYVYDVNHYLITSVHLPTTFQVIKASPDEPYLGLLLKIDQREMSQLMVDSSLPAPRPQQTQRGMAIGEVTLPLLAAFQRLTGLQEQPEDIPILAPIVQREILYRLLVGNQGARLRQIATAGSQGQQIARVIDWLKGNFTQDVRMEDLAAKARMGISSFHTHFRSMTSLSPLQYQKQLRLQEARRLMLAEHLDATSAAFQVGYESPSQFSREYRRLFGAPPLRDVTTLRHMATEGAEIQSG